MKRKESGSEQPDVGTEVDVIEVRFPVIAVNDRWPYIQAYNRRQDEFDWPLVRATQSGFLDHLVLFDATPRRFEMLKWKPVRPVSVQDGLHQLGMRALSRVVHVAYEFGPPSSIALPDVRAAIIAALGHHPHFVQYPEALAKFRKDLDRIDDFKRLARRIHDW